MTPLIQGWRRLMVLALLTLATAPAQAQTVDLLILYDNWSATWFDGEPEIAMRNWVTQMNDMYANSQVDITLNLVGVRPNENDGDNMESVLRSVQSDVRVRQLRDELGADLVSQLHRSGTCGIAFLSTEADYGYSVVGPDCGPLTMIHELGHGMGLAHSHRQGDDGGARCDYAVGHGVDSIFATIMAYSSAYGAPKIAKFSHPALDCNGFPCGVPLDQPEPAFAAKALQEIRAEVAAYRKVPVDDPVTPPGGDPSSVDSGHYLVEARHSGKCMSLAGRSGEDSAQAVQWYCHKGQTQRWQFNSRADGTFQIRSDYSKRCLQVSGSAVSSATLASCNSAKNQLWKVAKQASGGYSLQSVETGNYLMVRFSSRDNGAKIRQWPWTDDRSQRFNLKPWH